MYTYAKRAGDIGVALIIISFFSVLLLIVAGLIKADSKGPILFKQLRYGRNKRPFTIYKFRTMRIETPKNCATNDLKNSESYITRTGKYMRKLSIDELPQLLNVLKGDMSIIGPRPVILQEKELIMERDKYGANNCVPGITGWAQANGRDEIGIYDKARLDGEYASNIGPYMDVMCLLKTVETIIFAKGYSEGAPTESRPYSSTKAPAFYARIQSKTQTVNRIVRRKRPSLALPKVVSDIDT